ncbi:MAG: hypothetical protein IJZ61_06690 [Oscillospiraceae bacterium]|nr:hypothetical protein [Oscillospiraceae bacterium]
MKKALKIVVPIAVVIVLLVLFYFIFLVPRFELKKKIDEVMPSILNNSDYFTEYDIIDTSFVTVDNYNISDTSFVGAEDNEHISVDIPATMEYSINDGDISILERGNYYRNSAEEDICFYNRPNSLVNCYALTDNWADEMCDISIDDLKEGFDSLGYGNPFTEYGCWKCIRSVDKDDYSFWNIKSDYALYVSAYISSLVNELHRPDIWNLEYIYEKNNVCGIIHIKKYDNYSDDDTTKYYVIFDIFDASEADTKYKCSIDIRMQSLDDIYAVINSVEIIK